MCVYDWEISAHDLTCIAFGELFHLPSLFCISLEDDEGVTFMSGTDAWAVILRLLGGDQSPL